jgi:DNA-binding beta-propeller fold protein YncE
MPRHLPLPRVAGALASILSLVAVPELASAEATSLRPPAHGGVVVLDRAAYVAYVADADSSTLHRVDLVSGEVVSIPLACAPEQLALLGEDESGATRVAVALRGCNRVAVVDVSSSGEASVEASVEVPVEPWGLAVTPRGEILVTSAWGHALTALDGETLATRFTVDLAREPRSVVVTRDGRQAFVTHAVGDAVSAVELVPSGSGEGSPTVKRISGLSPRYRNAVDGAIGARTAHPTTSLAFAAALSESGTRLFIPHLAAQNGQEAVSITPGGYGGVPVEEDTTVASVAVLAVQTGEWVMPPALKSPMRSFAQTVSPAGATSRQPTAASVLGDAIYVTSYGTSELVELDARSLDPAMAPLRTFAVGDGPAGVDVDPATRIAVVYGRFSHDLSIVSLGSGTVDTLPVGADPLPADVSAGRKLFHTERDRRISRDGRACATCHPDGRDDGLTWRLGAGPRQTPTLLGRLERGPYGWQAKHTKLEDNVRETLARLGGRGLPEARLAELAAYVRRGLVAPARRAPADAATVERGKALFQSEAVGCGGCHVLEQGTSDRRLHDVASRSKLDDASSFRTPPLLFVEETAPYFHDGRYPTLEALLEDNLDRMGSTSQLSTADRSALLSFVRSL